MNDWKPGDVAMARGFGGEFLVVRTGNDGPSYWSAPMDWPTGEHEDELTFRPLVVIDPEDRGQVERLTKALCAATVAGGIHRGADNPDVLADALREFANSTPPKPVEPQGDGALIECDYDGKHGRAVRLGGSWTFYGDAFRDYAPYWDDFTSVRVLSEGVTS